jgi:membrane protein DedA with SNARE-associated domain
VGAVLGDNIGFAIGHFGGRRLVERYGRYVFLTPERLEKTTRFFDRHGGKIIIVARFIEGLRQANGIIAGTTGMHWSRFLIFNAIGAALWVAVWTSIGYLSGSPSRDVHTRSCTPRSMTSNAFRPPPQDNGLLPNGEQKLFSPRRAR